MTTETQQVFHFRVNTSSERVDLYDGSERFITGFDINDLRRGKALFAERCNGAIEAMRRELADTTQSYTEEIDRTQQYLDRQDATPWPTEAEIDEAERQMLMAHLADTSLFKPIGLAAIREHMASMTLDELYVQMQNYQASLMMTASDDNSEGIPF